MKNLFLAMMIVFSIFALGCGTSPSPSTEKRDTKSKHSYSIVFIDGCEYIECDYGVWNQRVYSLTHKGNCKSPIHSHNK